MMPDTSNALAHINEAIAALSVDMQSSPANGELNWSKVDPIQASIAIHLERVDSAIGPRGQSMFAELAEAVTQAMIELHAARDALAPDREKGA